MLTIIDCAELPDEHRTWTGNDKSACNHQGLVPLAAC